MTAEFSYRRPDEIEAAPQQADGKNHFPTQREVISLTFFIFYHVSFLKPNKHCILPL